MLKEAFITVFRKWPLSLLTFGIGILLGIIPSIFFGLKFSEIVHGKKALEELAYQFNFGLLTDFLQEHSKELIPFLWFALPAGFIGSLIYTYLSGGIIDQLSQSSKRVKWRSFFYFSSKLFWKYLLLLILIGLLLFSLFLVSGLVYFVSYLLAEGSTERGYILWLSIPTLFLVSGFSFGLTLSFYAKIMLYENKHISASKAFWAAFSYVLKNPKTLLFAALIGISTLFPRVIHGYLEQYIGMYGALKIMLITVVILAGLLIRFGLKNLQYAFAISYYNKYPLYFPILAKVENVTSENQEITESNEDVSTTNDEKSALSDSEEQTSDDD